MYLAVVLFALTDAATLQIASLALSKDLLASSFFTTQSLVALGRLLALGFIDRFPGGTWLLATGLTAGRPGSWAPSPRVRGSSWPPGRCSVWAWGSASPP